MKRIIPAAFILFSLILTGCSGSDVYQGTWKALDGEEKQFEITFSPKEMTIKKVDGDSEKRGYSQNSVSIKNSTRTYGIQVDNGMSYSVVFPVPDNVEKGAITDQNGQILFVIGKSKYYSYNDVFGL
jgi:hypothetical protein